MNPDRPLPLIDWSEHPAVVRARSREKFRTAAFAGLALAAGSILLALAVSNGLGPVDALYLSVVGLVWFFGVSALSSLVAFGRTNPGLKVYSDGLALPWRSLKDARIGKENFVAFQSIAEFRLSRSKGKSGIVVVRRDAGRPREFRIESQWIPDMDVLLASLSGRLTVKED